ncbi:MAG TPA: hypothetical protein VJX93_00690 [Candidatus Methanomethylophilaceae archaeon]|nr:hypothetical protein [Candidatus Methanomethylophilaceae archaeon]
MARKKRVKMRGVVHTSKRLEDELLESSKELAANPGLLRPMCAGNCRKCHFDKPFRDIENIATRAGNVAALKKDSSRGDELARAYAGTISLAADGSIPLLATAKLGDEKISYAVRGSVGADKMIGTQYYKDPKIRLLLYNNLVKKHKLHLYSFGEHIVCSNRPNMPEDYLYDAFWETPYEFKDDGLDCEHDSLAALEIKIKSLNETIRICSDCAKDVSTVQFLISRMAAIDPLNDMDVHIIHNYRSKDDGGRVPITGDELTKYSLGKVTDRGLISSAIKAGISDLKESGQATYMIGKKNYGSDTEAFLDAIRGPEEDKEALRLFLEAVPTPILIRSGRLGDAMTSVWESNYAKIIELSTSKETAESMGDVSRMVPSDVLATARMRYVMSGVGSVLPAFTRPGPMTVLCDTLTKAAKVGGGRMILEAMSNKFAKDSSFRAASAAFLTVCDPNAKYPFKLSAEEKDFRDYLLPFAKTLIDSEPSEYRDNMNMMLTASGSGESV